MTADDEKKLLENYLYWQTLITAQLDSNYTFQCLKSKEWGIVKKDTKEEIPLHTAIKQGLVPTGASQIPEAKLFQNISKNTRISSDEVINRAQQTLQNAQDTFKNYVYHQRMAANLTGGVIQGDNLIKKQEAPVSLQDAVSNGLLTPVFLKVPEMEKQATPILSLSNMNMLSQKAQEKAVADFKESVTYETQKAACEAVIDRVQATYKEKGDKVVAAEKKLLDSLKKPAFQLPSKQVQEIQKSVEPAVTKRLEQIKNQMSNQTPQPQPQPTTATRKVHQYKAQDYAHAHQRLNDYIKRGIITQNQLDTMLSNTQKLEKEGKLLSGVDANGKECSNSEIYVYKMMQAKLLYHPEAPVYQVKNGKRTNEKGKTVSETLGGDHRAALQTLSAQNADVKALSEIAECISSVENNIAATGEATAAVKVKGRRMSYNINLKPGYVEKEIKVVENPAKKSDKEPTKLTQQLETATNTEGTGTLSRHAQSVPEENNLPKGNLQQTENA